MGIIQRLISPFVDKQDSVVASVNDVHTSSVRHSSVQPYFGKRGDGVQIGNNKIESVRFKNGARRELFIKQDFTHGPLSFLFHGKYQCNTLVIAPVERFSSEYKVEAFFGVWEEGNLVCDEFKMGTFKGGTVNGKIVFNSINEFAAHPGASVSGEMRETNATLRDKKEIFGIQPAIECRLNENSTIGNISLLSLQAGQCVQFKDTNDRMFAFQVEQSYRDTGSIIVLKELTNNKNKVSLTWNHFRVTTTPAYNPADFDARSQIRIAKQFRVPKLFADTVMADITEIVVTNDLPELPVVAKNDSESNFVPAKIKF